MVYLDQIENLLGIEEWRHLKLSPLAIVPHKSRKYRAILDLSFSLKIFGMEIPSVNNNIFITATQHSMNQLDSVLPRLIEAVAKAPLEDGNMVFSKFDIMDGYWRMIVERGATFKFRICAARCGRGKNTHRHFVSTTDGIGRVPAVFL